MCPYMCILYIVYICIYYTINIHKHLCARLLVIVTIRCVLFSGHFDSAIFEAQSPKSRTPAAQTPYINVSFIIVLSHYGHILQKHMHIRCISNDNPMHSNFELYRTSVWNGLILMQSLQACQISPAGKRPHRVATAIWWSQREKRRSRECPDS